MPKVSEAHLEARRRQILEAAAVCFARRGFHSATMQEICIEAGLSPGAVYRYFRSKEEITDAIAEAGIRENVAFVEGIDPRMDTASALDELARFFFGMLEAPQACALNLELWSEAVRNDQVRATLRRSLDVHREALSALVRRAQDRGEINPALEPDSVARIMIALFDGLLVQRAVDPRAEIWPYVTAAKAMMTGQFWVKGEPIEREQQQRRQS